MWPCRGGHKRLVGAQNSHFPGSKFSHLTYLFPRGGTYTTRKYNVLFELLYIAIHWHVIGGPRTLTSLVLGPPNVHEIGERERMSNMLACAIRARGGGGDKIGRGGLGMN